MKYIFLTDAFESSALALRMQFLEGADVCVVAKHKTYNKILENILPRYSDYVQFMGQDNIFITDDASMGLEADHLRASGELVFGGSAASDSLENDRGRGQQAMKQCGIPTVYSINFAGESAFDKATEFIREHPGRWVLKQNGENEKDLSTVGKFPDGSDVIDKLDDLKRSWVTDINFDLQEFVDGHEAGLSAFFNGNDWLRDKSGEPIFEINWEHKKKSEGDTGATTGETCTLSKRAPDGSRLAAELLKTTDLLKRIAYIGNVDINFMISKKDGKAYGLEWTNRFGYPFLNLQMETFRTSWKELILRLTKGENNFADYDPKWAAVVVVQVPPFPFESTRERNNAKGQRVYFLNNGEWTGKDYLPSKVLKYVHFYEVRKNLENNEYECSGDTGYLLTVTGTGDTPAAANDLALKRIREGVDTSNMDYRKDCGVNDRVTSGIDFMRRHGYL